MDNKNDKDNVVVSSNSRGILYVTVGIAALFIAVVSGTFAYFTASATNNNAINGLIADTSIGLTVTRLDNDEALNGDNLIPMVSDSSHLISAVTNGCVDEKGYTACQVYKIAVSQKANSPLLVVTGTVNITGSSVSDISYTLLKDLSTTNYTSTNQLVLDVSADAFTAADTGYLDNMVKSGNDLVLTTLGSNTLVATTVAKTSYYYIIVWLDDDGTVQNDVTNTENYNGGSFTGTVTILSGNGQITAIFS